MFNGSYGLEGHVNEKLKDKDRDRNVKEGRKEEINERKKKMKKKRKKEDRANMQFKAATRLIHYLLAGLSREQIMHFCHLTGINEL